MHSLYIFGPFDQLSHCNFYPFYQRTTICYNIFTYKSEVASDQLNMDLVITFLQKMMLIIYDFFYEVSSV